MKIGYLGPQGTFTQQAAILFKKEFKSESIPEDFPTIEDTLIAVKNDEIDLAVVPLENSTEGVVNATIDYLIFDPLFIQKELTLSVEQYLMCSTELFKLEKIFSHSQSLAQCRKYLRKYYPDAELIPMTSNAEAARFVAASQNSAYAAIGPSLAADLYNLIKVENSIQDQKENATTFIAISKNSASLKTDDKTTIVFSTSNKPGSLYKILNIFALWDINMTKIISRPIKNKLGDYVFYVDLEDYILSDLEDALTMVKRKTNFFIFLGSYSKLAI